MGVLSLWLSKLRVCRGRLAGRPRTRWACRVRAGGRDSVLLRSQISHCCCVFNLLYTWKHSEKYAKPFLTTLLRFKQKQVAFQRPAAFVRWIDVAEFLDWLENATGSNWLRQATPWLPSFPPSFEISPPPSLPPSMRSLPHRCCPLHTEALFLSPSVFFSAVFYSFLSRAFVWVMVVIGLFRWPPSLPPPLFELKAVLFMTGTTCSQTGQ